MTYIGTVTVYADPELGRLAAIVEGRRSCAARAGVCSCGWIAPDAAGAEQATLDHLYGDLRGRARRFAYNPGPARGR